MSIILGALGGLIFAGAISAYFWPWLLANYDLFFTFVEEGQAKIVVKGESYSKTIISLIGHDIDERGNIIEAPQQEEEWWTKQFGVYWIGVPPFSKIFNYPLRWTSYKPRGENGAKAPVVKEEILSSIYIKDKVYYGRVEDVETNEGVPLNIEILATLKVVNPYKATFLINNWVEAIIDRIAQQVRVYVGTKAYMDLVSGETSVQTMGLSGFLKDALAIIAEDNYGVEFVSCDILTLNPPPEYRNTTTRLYTAQREADAKVAESVAKATAIKNVGNAEASVIEAKGLAEAKSLREREKMFRKDTEAAQALLKAEVGKAQGLGAIAEAVMKAVRGEEQ